MANQIVKHDYSATKATAGALHIASLNRADNTGVQVVNLMGSDNVSKCKIIPGWYTLIVQGICYFDRINRIKQDKRKILSIAQVFFSNPYGIKFK